MSILAEPSTTALPSARRLTLEETGLGRGRGTAFHTANPLSAKKLANAPPSVPTSTTPWELAEGGEKRVGEASTLPPAQEIHLLFPVGSTL
jgi:hypothetical protein